MRLHSLEPAEWDEFVNSHPNGHPFQLSAWGELKKFVGWESQLYGLRKNGQLTAGAQVLSLKIPVTKSKIAYIPRGPIVSKDSEAAKLLDQLKDVAYDNTSICLKIEPSWEEQSRIPKTWRKSRRTILHPETQIRSLDANDEDELFSSLDSEVRYSVRKSKRNGVTAERIYAEELPDAVWKLYQETGQRAGFNIHSEQYYRLAYKLLKNQGNIWLAKLDGEPIAFVWALHASQTAIFLYGGSNDIARKTLANYLLQWEIIRDYWKQGLKTYDLNGDVTEGVGNYKRKFASRDVTWVGTYDLPLRPASYWLWESFLPVIKPIARSLKQAKENTTKKY